MRGKKQQFVVTLTVAENAQLEELARRSETSKTAIIRSAFMLYRTVCDRAKKRDRVFIETEAGERIELMLLSLLPQD